MTMCNDNCGDRRPSWRMRLLLGLLLVPAGCKMTVLKPTSEDAVRERVAKVEKQNHELELENEGLRARLAESEKTITRDEAALEAATPQLVSMRISSSSVIETDSEGHRQLVLRLAPTDDRGRFMQVVGSLNVRVVAVPASGDPEPLAVARFDPVEVREAWRGGVLGSGYVFEIPLNRVGEGELPPTVDVVTHFSDARTGRDLRDEQPVRVLGAR